MIQTELRLMSGNMAFAVYFKGTTTTATFWVGKMLLLYNIDNDKCEKI